MKPNWRIIAGVAALGLFVYATRGILLPFLVGLAVAYLLDPVADRLEAAKFPRGLAAGTVLVLFFLVLGGILFAIFPLLRSQITALVNNLPDYFAAVRPYFADLWARLAERWPGAAGLASGDVIEGALRTGFSRLGDVIGGVLTGGRAIFNLLTLILISPVVAFFLLRDWDRLIARIGDLVPKKKAQAVHRIARDIDEALGGFVRGQTLAALVMAFLYAFGWSLVGLDYALVLGLIGGIMAYIPYVGALFTLFLALLIALGQFGLEWVALVQVLAVYGVVQALEAALLTPRLVGSHVRLHPVWVLFAIFAGGELMGFVGVLIAVPVAAALGVLARYWVARYLESPLHLGKPLKPATKGKRKR